MSYETYKRKIAERDLRLQLYHRKHPKQRQVDLAKRFKISQTSVSRILAKEVVKPPPKVS